MVLLAIPFGLAIGLSVGMLGGGGAVLAVPVLVYVLDQPVHEATTTSLVVVAAAALAAGIRQALDDRVCWRHAGALALPAAGGILLGTAANTAVDGALLLALFAPVMLVAAWATWRRAGSAPPGGEQQTGCPPLVLRRDISLGLGVGLLTGFFGVGGGFVVVPTLALALGFAMRNAIGTSLVIVSAVSLFGLGVHLAAGNALDLSLTAVMTLACVAGAILGAGLGPLVAPRTLGRSFAVLVTLVALYLLASTAFLGGPPAS
ncbi:MAG: sulfite exporter TauE/SafE family protein [Thermoleophilaceae bacterium]